MTVALKVIRPVRKMPFQQLIDANITSRWGIGGILGNVARRHIAAMEVSYWDINKNATMSLLS